MAIDAVVREIVGIDESVACLVARVSAIESALADGRLPPRASPGPPVALVPRRPGARPSRLRVVAAALVAALGIAGFALVAWSLLEIAGSW